MAQERFWNFREDDSTFLLSRGILGFLNPGVYRGFDSTLDNTLVLKLTHQLTGQVETNENLTVSAKKSAIITKQGVGIKEDASIDLPVSAGDGSNPRIDLVMVEHEYIDVIGGAVAIYSVVEGTPAATPVVPSLPNPEKQVRIGELFVPTGMAALDDANVVWTRDEAPNLAGKLNIAFTDFENIFTQMQHWGDDAATLSGISLTLPDGGNTVNVTLDNPELHYISDEVDGTFVAIKFVTGTSGAVTMKNFQGSPPAGFSRLNLGSDLIGVGSSVGLFLKTDSSGTSTYDLIALSSDPANLVIALATAIQNASDIADNASDISDNADAIADLETFQANQESSWTEIDVAGLTVTPTGNTFASAPIGKFHFRPIGDTKTIEWRLHLSATANAGADITQIIVNINAFGTLNTDFEHGNGMVAPINGPSNDFFVFLLFARIAANNEMKVFAPILWGGGAFGILRASGTAELN